MIPRGTYGLKTIIDLPQASIQIHCLLGLMSRCAADIWCPFGTINLSRLLGSLLCSTGSNAATPGVAAAHFCVVGGGGCVVGRSCQVRATHHLAAV